VGTAVVALLLSVVGFAVATLLLAREARRAGANYERGRSFVEGTIDRIASGLTEEPALGSTLRGVLEDALGFFEGSSPVADAREAALDDEGRGRILHALGRHEEAAAALRLALERLSPDGQRLERVRVRRRLAEVHVDWGRHDAAAEAFALALDETEALPAGAARARERTRILYGMGRLCERLERLADADQAYTEALLILDPLLAGDPTNREYRYDIARCCHRLRIVRTRMLGPEAGLELGKRALTLANGLQAEAPDVSRYVQLRAALYMTRLKVDGMLPPWEAEPRPGPVSGGSSTALGPDWMHFQASAIQTSQRTEEPFEVHAYEGTSNLLGGFQAEATVYLFPTVEGMKGTTRYVMRDEEGNELVCQFFGEQDEDTPDFKGTFVIVEATGRYLGARGAGQHEIVEHGRVVELRVEGSIRRE
jgi:tetratricopeptide (TPR) repeat protein